MPSISEQGTQIVYAAPAVDAEELANDIVNLDTRLQTVEEIQITDWRWADAHAELAQLRRQVAALEAGAAAAEARVAALEAGAAAAAAESAAAAASVAVAAAKPRRSKRRRLVVNYGQFY